MSHFTKQGTKMVHVSCLVKALYSLFPEEAIEVNLDNKMQLRGYEGNYRTNDQGKKIMANIRIKGEGWKKHGGKNYVGGASNDLGSDRDWETNCIGL